MKKYRYQILTVLTAFAGSVGAPQSAHALRCSDPDLNRAERRIQKEIERVDRSIEQRKSLIRETGETLEEAKGFFAELKAGGVFSSLLVPGYFLFRAGGDLAGAFLISFMAKSGSELATPDGRRMSASELGTFSSGAVIQGVEQAREAFREARLGVHDQYQDRLDEIEEDLSVVAALSLGGNGVQWLSLRVAQLQDMNEVSRAERRYFTAQIQVLDQVCEDRLGRGHGTDVSGRRDAPAGREDDPSVPRYRGECCEIPKDDAAGLAVD